MLKILSTFFFKSNSGNIAELDIPFKITIFLWIPIFQVGDINKKTKEGRLHELLISMSNDDNQELYFS